MESEVILCFLKDESKLSTQRRRQKDTMYLLNVEGTPPTQRWRWNLRNFCADSKMKAHYQLKDDGRSWNFFVNWYQLMDGDSDWFDVYFMDNNRLPFMDVGNSSFWNEYQLKDGGIRDWTQYPLHLSEEIWISIEEIKFHCIVERQSSKTNCHFSSGYLLNIIWRHEVQTRIELEWNGQTRLQLMRNEFIRILQLKQPSSTRHRSLWGTWSIRGIFLLMGTLYMERFLTQPTT